MSVFWNCRTAFHVTDMTFSLTGSILFKSNLESLLSDEELKYQIINRCCYFFNFYSQIVALFSHHSPLSLSVDINTCVASNTLFPGGLSDLFPNILFIYFLIFCLFFYPTFLSPPPECQSGPRRVVYQAGAHRQGFFRRGVQRYRQSHAEGGGHQDH